MRAKIQRFLLNTVTPTLLKVRLVYVLAPGVYDSVVLLGTKGTNQTEKELRLVGYHCTK